MSYQTGDLVILVELEMIQVHLTAACSIRPKVRLPGGKCWCQLPLNNEWIDRLSCSGGSDPADISGEQQRSQHVWKFLPEILRSK